MEIGKFSENSAAVIQMDWKLENFQNTPPKQSEILYFFRFLQFFIFYVSDFDFENFDDDVFHN